MKRRAVSSLASGLMIAIFASASAAQGEYFERLVPELAQGIAKAGRKTVAVADFTDLQGRVTELGRFLAEDISVALVNAAFDFRVMDRGHIRTLLAELKLSDQGIIDPNTAGELGRVAGVEILITGTVTDLDETVRVAIKALQTETAAIVAARSIDLRSNAALKALLRRDVSSTLASPSGERRGSVATPPNIRAFQNDFLIVTVDSAAVSQDGKRVSLALGFENKSSVDEYLSTLCCPGASLSDSAAGSWSFDFNRSSGLAYNPTVILRQPDVTSMTRLAAGARHTVVLQFTANLTEVERPTSVSFSLPVYRRRGSNVEPLSVGISRIPVGP